MPIDRIIQLCRVAAIIAGEPFLAGGTREVIRFAIDGIAKGQIDVLTELFVAIIRIFERGNTSQLRRL